MILLLALSVTFCLSAASKVVTTCLEQATDQVGNIASGTPVNDYPLLVEEEGKNWYMEMHSVRMCKDQFNNLKGMVSQMQKVGELFTEFVTLNEFGNLYYNQWETYTCVNLTMGSNEHIVKIELKHSDTAIHHMVLTTDTGRTFTVGRLYGTDTDAVLEFTPDEPLVGFWGTDGSDWFSSLGGITYKKGCRIGQIIEDPAV